MNKLIELLNKYDEGGNWRKLHWKGLGCEDHNTIGYKDKELTCEQDEVVAYLISKKFGFIKWLVDNDKIDIDKYYEFMTNENIDISNACGELDMDKEFYYELLMILAVQDNSIEFLISILK